MDGKIMIDLDICLIVLVYHESLYLLTKHSVIYVSRVLSLHAVASARTCSKFSEPFRSSCRSIVSTAPTRCRATEYCAT